MVMPGTCNALIGVRVPEEASQHILYGNIIWNACKSTIPLEFKSPQEIQMSVELRDVEVGMILVARGRYYLIDDLVYDKESLTGAIVSKCDREGTPLEDVKATVWRKNTFKHYQFRCAGVINDNESEVLEGLEEVQGGGDN